MRFEWTPLVVAIVALIGTLFTAWRTSGRKDRATVHVERADAVVELQAGELNRLASELLEVRQDLKASRLREEALEDEIDDLRSALGSVSGRVARLEAEVLRLGGDPALVF